MEELRQFILKIHPVGRDALDRFVNHWHPLEFSRGEIVTRAGQVERYFYFMTEGIQKAYYEKNGKEHVIAFTLPPAFTCIPESFVTRQPSHYFLQCITPCKVLRISHEQIEALADESPDIEKLIRKSHERILAGLITRYHQLIACTIEERFNLFVSRSPHLLNIIPHKDIASYLGMNATNFSKLYNSIRI
jgi:CRP-like cAMP-binding protein